MDAAVNIPNRNGRHLIYFFSGDKYSRFNMATGRVDDQYPLGISGRWGSMRKVHAAFLLDAGVVRLMDNENNMC